MKESQGMTKRKRIKLHLANYSWITLLDQHTPTYLAVHRGLYLPLARGPAIAGFLKHHAVLHV